MEMQKGVLYWITGLSGAGKTTIGNRLYYEMKKKQDNVVLLDGDILKQIVNDTPGYSVEDRRERAYKYAKLCKSLTDQGLVVICCTIAMFHEVREWNRRNNKGYVEIFVNTPMEVLNRRDQKGMYSAYQKGEAKDIVGKDVSVELPLNPDIEIVNDDCNDIDECVKSILDYDVEMNSDYSRDTGYWNEIYKQESISLQPSLFAKFVLEQLEKGRKLLELGCGNGRDCLFFLKNGMQVTGVDASDVAIGLLNKKVSHEDSNKAWFVCDDFVSSSFLKTMQFDYIYSRFTLHAINEKQETELLNNVYGALKNGGEVFIEARSIRDPLYGKGTLVGKHSYIYNSHYRRFIDKSELLDKMTGIGFDVLYEAEQTGFAPTKDDDPPIVRVVAKKMLTGKACYGYNKKIR